MGDRNDVDIDSMNSNDNPYIYVTDGFYIQIQLLILTNSITWTNLWLSKLLGDNAVVLGNGANGNVGLIYQN